MLEFIYDHISLQSMIWLAVAFPLFGAVVNGALCAATARSEGARFKTLSSFVGVATAMATLGAAAVLFVTLSGLEAGSPSAITGPLFRWAAVGDLHVDIGLRVDQLSLIVALAVSGISFLIRVYSIGYMWNSEGYLRFFALIDLALFFMMLAILADNLILMFVGLGGVSATSLALIGFVIEDADSAGAMVRAAVANLIGDACLAAAAFIAFGAMAASGVDPEFGLFNFETMERHAAYFVPIATPVALLVFAGAVAKSAQLPLHFWLPDSARAEVPASALMSSVTMAVAGVYLVVRLNFIFALSPTALAVVGWVGAAGVILAAAMALCETDIRRILAYSTISQFGFIYIAVGIGAFAGAVFHLISHSLFKALLILAAGSAVAAAGGEADIMRIGGLKRRMPITAWAFVVAAAALAGIAPTCGFFSLQSILGQAFERGHTALWIVGFAGVGLSSFYIFRAAGSVFFGEPRMTLTKYKRATEQGLSMVLPTMLLITLVAVGGIAGVPRCLGGGNAIDVWLGGIIPSEMSRAPGGACGTWIVLAAVTLLWSAHFAVLGWLIYAQKRDWPARIARRIRPLVTLIEQRYYIDRLLSIAVARPLGWIARGLVSRGFDRTVVDGIAVEGASRTAGLAGALAAAAQTGVLHHYMLYFLIGAILIIALVAL